MSAPRDTGHSLRRGFAPMSGTAGPIAHIAEEIADPITPELRRALREGSPPEGR